MILNHGHCIEIRSDSIRARCTVDGCAFRMPFSVVGLLVYLRHLWRRFRQRMTRPQWELERCHHMRCPSRGWHRCHDIDCKKHRRTP